MTQSAMRNENATLVVVTGSRTIKDQDQIAFIWSELRKAPEGTLFFHGGAKGADDACKQFVFGTTESAHSSDSPAPYSVREFPANWKPVNDKGEPLFTGKYDRAAGPKRNRWMIDTAVNFIEFARNHDKDPSVIVLAFTDKPLVDSKGTRDCVTYARDKGLTVHHFRTDLKKEVPLS